MLGPIRQQLILPMSSQICACDQFGRTSSILTSSHVSCLPYLSSLPRVHGDMGLSSRRKSNHCLRYYFVSGFSRLRLQLLVRLNFDPCYRSAGVRDFEKALKSEDLLVNLLWEWMCLILEYSYRFYRLEYPSQKDLARNENHVGESLAGYHLYPESA